MNTKCPDEVSFMGQTGSFEVMLEVPSYHQLTVLIILFAIPSVTEGRPLVASPPLDPPIPDPPSSSGAGELVLCKNIYSLSHSFVVVIYGDEGIEATERTQPHPREMTALLP